MNVETVETLAPKILGWMQFGEQFKLSVAHQAGRADCSSLKNCFHHLKIIMDPTISRFLNKKKMDKSKHMNKWESQT